LKIQVQTFAGIVPKVSPRLLAESQAQVAQNTRLESGDLETWLGLSPEQALTRSAARSLYRFKGRYWFEWGENVDAVRAPLPGDVSARVYFTGAGVPRFTDNEQAIVGDGPYPANSYVLGLPVPASGLSVSASGTIINDDPALIETRAYAYTFVSKYGEESAPSPASNFVDWQPGQTVTVTGFAVPTGEFVIDAIRLYRTASSGAGTIYQFVDEIGVTRDSYRDNVDNDRLGEELPTTTWIGPPENMHSLVTLPNGMLAGASGLDICISEQYVPHAWPDEYRHTADDPVVALGVIDNSLIVLTGRAPYVITGASPASMTMTEIGSPDFACVSRRGVASVPGLGVVYPTANGLAGITAGGVANLIGNYMSREQWAAYQPETMQGLAHRGRWFGFYDGGCLVYDPAGGDGALYELDLDVAGGYRDPATDTLYLIVDGQIQAWNEADTPFAAYRWRSKRYELPRPSAFSAARIRAASYTDLTLNLIANDTPVASLPVPGPTVFRLPIVQRSADWAFELTGTDRVYDVAIAETADEI